MQSRGHTLNVKAAEHELMRNRFLYEFGARGIFPTGCLELALIVVRFRRTLTLTLTKPSSKPSFAIHYLYSQTKSVWPVAGIIIITECHKQHLVQGL